MHPPELWPKPKPALNRKSKDPPPPTPSPRIVDLYDRSITFDHDHDPYDRQQEHIY